MKWHEDPAAKENRVRAVLHLLQEMSDGDRARVLEGAREFMCLLCGQDAPCYCAPCYDE